MVVIRPARAADGPVIAEIRAETWRVAYAGLIAAETLAELTAPEAVAREGAWRAARPLDGFLIAETAGPGETAGVPEAVGFAAFGPERSEEDAPGQPLPGPPEQDRAELYAIYVRPARWDTGAGRALVQHVLALAAEAGYADISLWVLEGNARGRRFYDRAGFQATGESVALTGLGGVTEVRYRRPLG
jgi:ribosomal protein S18 acetylase RimI-like enzyme